MKIDMIEYCIMPNIKSAIKALRQSKRRRVYNLRRQRAVSTVTKNIRKLLLAGKKDDAANLLPQAYKALDKAAKTNVIAKNTASRNKSRLAKKILQS
jgi:small subunit ribosomal protein S20